MKKDYCRILRIAPSVLSFVALTFLPLSLWAENSSLSPYQARIDASVDLDMLRPLSVVEARGTGRRSALRSAVVIGIQGKRLSGTISLDSFRPQTFRTLLENGYQSQDITIPIGTYTGTGRFKASRGSVPVAASVYLDDDGKKAIKAIFSYETGEEKRDMLQSREIFPGGKKKFVAKVSVARDKTLPAAACGADSMSLTHGAGDVQWSPSIERSTRAASQVFSVDIDADPLYVAATGGSSGAQSTLATTFSLVNSRSYEPYLDLTAEIEDITILGSDPFSGVTNAEDLVNAFFAYKANQSGKAAVSLLFTGKDFDGSTIGIAAFQGFCTTNPYISVGAIQRINDNTDYLITAHEMGHLVGSDHYDAPTYPENLMSSVLNFKEDFITPSINQINTLLAAQGGPCLNSGGSGGGSSPTPTPTTSATATPTPGGGDGGGSGGTPSGSAPIVSLDADFNKSLGELNLTLQLSSIEEGCFVRLLTGKSSGSVTSSGREATRFTPTLSVTQSLTCSVANKIKKEMGNKSARRVYVVAESICSDPDKVAQYSEVLTLKPAASKSGKGTAKKWFRKCAKQF